MVKAGASPTLGRVTATAVGAELPIVVVILGMAGVTVRRCALIPIGMT